MAANLDTALESKEKRRKRERIIKHGRPSPSESGDARRKAAKLFLSQITLNGETVSQMAAVDNFHSRSPESNLGSVPCGHNRTPSNGKAPQFVSPPKEPTTTVSEEEKQPLTASPEPGAVEKTVFSPNISRLPSVESPRVQGKSPHDAFRWPLEIPEPISFPTRESCFFRVAYVTSDCAPFAMFTTLLYNKDVGKSSKEKGIQITRSHMNSVSLQLELDGIHFGGEIEDISLSTLLDPVWVIPSQESPLQQPDQVATPDPVRNVSKCAEWEGAQTPGVELSSSYYCQLDNHSALTIIVNYNPHCLNNPDHFVGKDTTTLTLQGYRVSILHYSKPSDRKRLINDRFKQLFPHIGLPLTRIQSSKNGIHRIAIECGIDLAVVAHAYTYFEKVVLMGKVNKENRKLVAGVCLLLATKFYSDMKKNEIRSIIDQMTDLFRVSSRELLLHEFPVLLTLQFSLVTPTQQVQEHFNLLKVIPSSTLS